MIEEASDIYSGEIGKPFLPDEYLGFSKENLIVAMYEGYMETRYPSVFSASRHFPGESKSGLYHCPLGSSFFTDFIEIICRKCWGYLIKNNLNAEAVLSEIEEQFKDNHEYEHFEQTYLCTLK